MGRKWQGIGYAYYAAKFVSFPAVLNQIEQAPNLYAVKAIAYVNKDSRPANWASKRLTIRYRLIVTLVRGYPLLKEKLLKTGTRPIVNVEEHPFWGIGLDGAGENQVGKLLERLRALG